MGGLYDKWATNRKRDYLLEGFGATRTLHRTLRHYGTIVRYQKRVKISQKL